MFDSIGLKGDLSPINEQSGLIMQKKEFALIGISPFNSYFSAEKIFTILKQVDKNFEDYAIFIPDKISGLTLKALGYDDNRISNKIRKQDNYLNNRAKKAIDKLNELSETKKHSYVKIINLSSIENRPNYIASYKRYTKMMVSNQDFRKGCISTSAWILSSSEKKDKRIDDNAKEIAVEYFIKELPLFLEAPSILNVNSCVFIYNSIPVFLQEIYDNYNLASQTQGFAIFHETSV